MGGDAEGGTAPGIEKARAGPQPFHIELRPLLGYTYLLFGQLNMLEFLYGEVFSKAERRSAV
jgi:hypothetical protein